MREFRSIAIDGPSGAGKSTMAKKAAEKFGFVYVDTGAIYRSIGLFVLRAGVDSKDREGVKALLSDIHLDIKYENGVQHMLLNGEDVSSEIRMPKVSIYASDVSAMPEVRAFLLEMQRDIARKNDVIMDGRDIGTVVLPDAQLKIFLTASPEERARRRMDELKAKGLDVSFEEVLRDIRYRDDNDSSRAAAPLRAADDAVIIDTTGNTLSRSIEIICAAISGKFGI